MDNPKLDTILFCVKQIEATVEKMDKIVSGNGEPGSGLIVRMDRAEQFIMSAKKFIWILVGASLTPGAVLAAVQYFTKG